MIGVPGAKQNDIHTGFVPHEAVGGIDDIGGPAS
jgi:hypothetical protein